jgi:beta-phosphoglucomutase family hydrolase
VKDPSGVISKEKFDAVLFDLDGVLTATASIHAACWKEMFDDFLRRYSEKSGQAFQPFEIESDYRPYVDGRPRYEGVRAFLESRDIRLKEGEANDSPSLETICGLGNRKNDMVNEAIRIKGVEPFAGSVALVRHLREAGLKTAVVSASANCQTVLEGAGIADLFDIRIDGKVASEKNLPGKPAPDTFLAAAELLNVPPQRAVVVEDAISGVQAGRDGNFGLVIGVSREGDPEDLRKNGADIVVNDLSEVLPR